MIIFAPAVTAIDVPFFFFYLFDPSSAALLVALTFFIFLDFLSFAAPVIALTFSFFSCCSASAFLIIWKIYPFVF